MHFPFVFIVKTFNNSFDHCSELNDFLPDSKLSLELKVKYHIDNNSSMNTSTLWHNISFDCQLHSIVDGTAVHHFTVNNDIQSLILYMNDPIENRTN